MRSFAMRDMYVAAEHLASLRPGHAASRFGWRPSANSSIIFRENAGMFV
jgi:hypothetical protein